MTGPRRGGVQFILVHSPSVGPRTWLPVADWLQSNGHEARVPSLLGIGQHPPYWPFLAARVGDAIAATERANPVIVAMHSNAGLFASQVAERLPPGAGLIFVDASIPPDAGTVEVVPAALLAELRAKAIDGVLPRWTDWWTDDDVAALFPDDRTRQAFADEQPHLPLDYYERRIPIEPGWTDRPCGYLLFGAPYEPTADEALRRGWPVVRVPGEHLHMLVEPAAVAGALLELAGRLASTSPSPGRQ